MDERRKIEPDIIEHFGYSIIQHGSHNDRIYLMKASPADLPSLPSALIEMASRSNYTKIFAKVPEEAQLLFLQEGYLHEASVPYFFGSGGKVFFMSYFLDERRGQLQTSGQNEEVLLACHVGEATGRKEKPLAGRDVQICRATDADAMAVLYAQVFLTYPVPISEPGYIRDTMESHMVYFGIWEEGRLVALSAAEMDAGDANVEMTGFAIVPEHRGDNLSALLLSKMEIEMQARGMKTAYAIARASSFGMNRTFTKLSYTFGGQLIKNTNIGGQLEDMNVWYKTLNIC